MLAGWILGFADSVSPAEDGPRRNLSGIKGDISGTALGITVTYLPPRSIIPAGKTESGALSRWQQPDIRRDGRIGFRIGMGASLQVFIADGIYNGNPARPASDFRSALFPSHRNPEAAVSEGIGVLLRKEWYVGVPSPAMTGSPSGLGDTYPELSSCITDPESRPP